MNGLSLSRNLTICMFIQATVSSRLNASSLQKQLQDDRNYEYTHLSLHTHRYLSQQIQVQILKVFQSVVQIQSYSQEKTVQTPDAHVVLIVAERLDYESDSEREQDGCRRCFRSSRNTEAQPLFHPA